MPPPQAPPASGFTILGPSFSRSYGGNLPSSLTTVLPIALVFSTCPPVSVWGTGAVPTHCWDFLGSMGSVTSPESDRHHVSGLRSQLSSEPPYTLTRGTTIAPDHLPSCVLHQLPATSSARIVRRQPLTLPILGLARTRRYRNINRLCIDYASRPRLSSRLTLGGLALPRNPWTSGGGVFHPSFATHACILTRWRSTTDHSAASLHHRRSPTAPACAGTHSFGSGLEPRYIVRAGSLDQ